MAPLLVVTVTNIVSVPLFYRFLGSEMYALWFYVLTLTGAFGFVDLGIGVAVGRYIGVALGSENAAAVREYWGTGNVIVIPLLFLMALVFVAVGVVEGPRWFHVAPAMVSLMRWSFVAGGAGLFLSYYGQYWLILSQAHLDFKFIGVVRSVMSLVQIIPSIALAWLTHNPFILIVWAALVGVIQLVLFVWHAENQYRIGFCLRAARRERAREMAVYTGKTFATLLANSFLASADRLLLGRLAPAPSFAHYTIAANVGARIQGLSGAVMGPVFSNSSRSVGTGDRHSLAKVYNETFEFTFPWYLFAALWLSLWHPVLLRAWLGPGLAQSVAPVFVPIVLGCCLTAIANISGAQLGPMNLMGTQLAFVLLTGFLLFAGVYLGWKWNGLTGAAWGFTASRAGLFAQDLFVLSRTGAGGWMAATTWKTIAFHSAAAACFALSYLFVPAETWWLLVPAALHAAVITSFLLRQPLQRLLANNSKTVA